MKFRYNVVGLDCPHCASRLASMIEAKEEVTSCKINFLTEKLTVETELDENEALKLVTDTAKAFSKSVKIKVD